MTQAMVDEGIIMQDLMQGKNASGHVAFIFALLLNHCII
ncbi:hypothetical protein [Marmot herpesvirus 1]|nr:hypothetical protein [Marmot herpesvirus 1]